MNHLSRPAGLYTHIPFCLKKCNYCSFYSVTDTGRIDAFVSALLREMQEYGDFASFESVYFGGGTPSLLGIPYIEKIVTGIHRNFSIAHNSEWTIEANPGDLDETRCRALRDLGFNRINIGIQSLDDGILSFLGRRHTREAAIKSVRAARSAGFGNMGLDMIYGIPGQDADACLEDLRELAAMAPEHLSCYQLSLESGTPLFNDFQKGAFTKLDQDTEFEYFMRISDLLTDTGYTHYEVSNYALKPEFRSRHNRKYWDHTPYLGLGPAAHSFDGSHRRWNHSSVEAYCSDLSDGKRPIEKQESLGIAEMRLETLCLNLRTIEGLSITEFEERYGEGSITANLDLLKMLAREGLLTLKDSKVVPTRKGLAIADALAVLLDQAIDSSGVK